MNETDKTTPPVSTVRRRVGQVLVIVAAGFALFTAGWGMWHFFTHRVGIADWWLVLPMFLLFDFAGVACAWNARINRIEHGQIGVEGWLVWLFATLSGLMSASDATGLRASAVRFAAPLVAAILFELLIRGERKDVTGGDETGMVGRIKRRILARLGLLDALDLDDAAAARASAAARIAVLAYRVHQTVEGSWRRRRAVRRYHRRLRSATERFRFATDAEMIGAVRAHLAALYQSVSGTAETALVDLNVWRAADAHPVPDDAAVEVEEAAPDPWACAEPIDVDQADSEPDSVASAAPSSDTATDADTEPANPTDTVADSEPATPAVKKPPASPPRKRTPAAKKSAGKPANETAKKVARWAARMPDATHAEIAAKAGVSVRSVERYRPAKEPASEPATPPASETVNGHAVPDLITTD